MEKRKIFKVFLKITAKILDFFPYTSEREIIFRFFHYQGCVLAFK